MNYWNIVNLNEVLEDFYGAKTVLLISSRSAELSDEYDKSLINSFAISLEEISDCMFIWDESYTAKQLKHELEINKLWKHSAELLVEDNDFENPIEETEEETEQTESSTETEETEEVEETTEAEVTETSEETEVDDVSTSPSKTITIKDWNDLKDVKIAYSFLKNYLSFCPNGELIRRMDGIPFRTLLETLEKYDIVDKEVINNIQKVFDINERMNSSTSSFNGPVQTALIANNCEEKVVNNLNKVYLAGMDLYNDLYVYWMSLLCTTDVAYAKAIMKTAMDTIVAKTKSSKELFEFELLDIPSETSDYKVKTPKIEGTQWKLINVEKETFGYKTTEQLLLIETDKDCIDSEILATLKVRGLSLDMVPLFKLPNTVSDINDVRRLLSGIANFTEYGIEFKDSTDIDTEDFDEEFDDENYESEDLDEDDFEDEDSEEYNWDDDFEDEDFDESEGIPTMLINTDELED